MEPKTPESNQRGPKKTRKERSLTKDGGVEQKEGEENKEEGKEEEQGGGRERRVRKSPFLKDMRVTFLGTSSGAGPTATRNCSSLALDVVGDENLWLVDCAEGTVRQFAQQPAKKFTGGYRAQMHKVRKIFITHMHADHVMGLVTLLRNILGHPDSNQPPDENDNGDSFHPDLDGTFLLGVQTQDPLYHRHRQPLPSPPWKRVKVEIFGPKGIRRFVRSAMKLTKTKTKEQYAVHELLRADEVASCPRGRGGIYPNLNVDDGGLEGYDALSEDGDVIAVDPSEDEDGDETLHPSEYPGRDIRCGPDGFWREITVELMGNGLVMKVIVDAGAIAHRDPCLGFIIREYIPKSLNFPVTAARSLVILGDTCEPTNLISLINSPTALSHSHSLTSRRDPSAHFSVPNTNDKLSSASSSSAVSSSTSFGSPTDLSITKLPPPPLTVYPCLPTRVSLLVHEATDAYVASHTSNGRVNEEILENKMRDKGHSTPRMAGKFGRMIGAERLVLNHLSWKYPAPPLQKYERLLPYQEQQQSWIREIERQATLPSEHPLPPPPPSLTSTLSLSPQGSASAEAGKFRETKMSVTAAWDFMSLTIPSYWDDQVESRDVVFEMTEERHEAEAATQKVAEKEKRKREKKGEGKGKAVNAELEGVGDTGAVVGKPGRGGRGLGRSLGRDLGRGGVGPERGVRGGARGRGRGRGRGEGGGSVGPSVG